MICSLLHIGFQTIPANTGVPIGATAAVLGKLKPHLYTALRDSHTLPPIANLDTAKRNTFTGDIITLDYPQRGMVHVMNFVKGKRLVLENPKQQPKENGVPLSKYLATLPPKIDIRYARPNESSFEVKLPGQEKKLQIFTGILTSLPMKPGEKGMTIQFMEGKVVRSSWLSIARH
ncbi:MAG: hypothetical protein WCG75_07230 [Armatimonadota bacterium]